MSSNPINEKKKRKEQRFILAHGSGHWEVQEHRAGMCSPSTHGRKLKGQMDTCGMNQTGEAGLLHNKELL
jgi:hypothetical protein